MSSFLSIDGPLYRILSQVYNLLVLNLLWFLFSIPLFTIGASNTAVFYVTRKIVNDRDYSTPVKDFWNSFKQNFLQATVIWLIMLFIAFLTYYNIRNIHLFAAWGKYIAVVYYLILAEIIIIGIYIFPILSRYYVKTVDAFKIAFFIGNRYFITTILCLMVLPAVYFLISWKRYFILFTMSIYSFWIYSLINRKIQLYEAMNNPDSDSSI